MWVLLLATWGLTGAAPEETAKEAPRLYLEPDHLPSGTGTIDVRFDLPGGIQGWAYAVCITDCDRARFLRVEEDPEIAAIVRDEFEILEVEDCVVRRSVVLDITGTRTFGPADGMRDISLIVESYAPTDVCICMAPDDPPLVPVFVAGGASTAVEPPFDCCAVGLGPLMDLACTPEPLACDAWAVYVTWRKTGRVDTIRYYANGELLSESSGAASWGYLYGLDQGSLEFCIEPVVGGAAGDRVCCHSDIPSGRSGFIRGDANQDGAVDVADPIALLNLLFRDAWLFYQPAGDSNADGATDIADAVYLLQYLFAGGNAPPSPFPDCGV